MAMKTLVNHWLQLRSRHKRVLCYVYIPIDEMKGSKIGRYPVAYMQQSTASHRFNCQRNFPRNRCRKDSLCRSMLSNPDDLFDDQPSPEIQKYQRSCTNQKRTRSSQASARDRLSQRLSHRKGTCGALDSSFHRSEGKTTGSNE